MRSTFDKATTVRIKPDVREEVRTIAEREGNTEAAVIRRALAAGLEAIRRENRESSGR